MDWSGFLNPEVVARFLATAFFAVVFLQSGLDKIVDRPGNLAYFQGVFKQSPIRPAAVQLLFWALTVLELTAGLLCLLGILSGGFAREGMNVAAAGLIAAGVVLLCLAAGQRIAKDYAGAAVIAAYFAVALIGLSLF